MSIQTRLAEEVGNAASHARLEKRGPATKLERGWRPLLLLLTTLAAGCSSSSSSPDGGGSGAGDGATDATNVSGDGAPGDATPMTDASEASDAPTGSADGAAADATTGIGDGGDAADATTDGPPDAGQVLPGSPDGGVEDGGAESASDGAIEAAVIGTCSNPTELDSCPNNTTCASDVFDPPVGCWDEIDPSVSTSVWCCAGLIPPDAGAAPPFTGCPSAVPVACQEGWFGYIVVADACDIPDSWTGCYDGIIAPYDPGVNTSATLIYCCPLSDAGAAEGANGDAATGGMDEGGCGGELVVSPTHGSNGPQSPLVVFGQCAGPSGTTTGGQTLSSQTIEISNPGTAPVAWTAQVSTPYFTIDSTAGVLDGGDSVMITVSAVALSTYPPGQTVSDTIVVTEGDEAGCAVSIPIQESFQGYFFTPASLDFGNVALSTPSPSMHIAATWTGGLYSAGTLSASPSPEFSGSTVSGSTGLVTGLDVTFTPAALGARSGTVSFVGYMDPVCTPPNSLTGTGIAGSTP